MRAKISFFVLSIGLTNSVFASSFGRWINKRLSSCPASEKFTNLINNPSKVNSNCGKYNQEVLEQISTLPSGGGYSLKGSATNVPLKMGNSPIVNPKAKTSFCTGATYTVAMKVFQKNHVFDNMTPEQKKNFALQHNDNYGFWGAWNNNYEGAGDANRLIKFGEKVPSLKEACAGDFFNFNRKNGTGHSVIYLGQEDGKVYYWSSNKSTKGFGVSCYPIDKIVLSASPITRMTHPENVANIEKYSGKNYAQYYKKKDNVPSNRDSTADFLAEGKIPTNKPQNHSRAI
jgi:hypothetical protein